MSRWPNYVVTIIPSTDKYAVCETGGLVATMLDKSRADVVAQSMTKNGLAVVATPIDGPGGQWAVVDLGRQVCACDNEDDARRIASALNETDRPERTEAVMT